MCISIPTQYSWSSKSSIINVVREEERNLIILIPILANEPIFGLPDVLELFPTLYHNNVWPKRP